MIDYDSFSHCHLTDIFFAIFAGAKELMITTKPWQVDPRKNFKFWERDLKAYTPPFVNR